jgi:hypothetical protein
MFEVEEAEEALERALVEDGASKCAEKEPLAVVGGDIVTYRPRLFVHPNGSLR